MSSYDSDCLVPGVALERMYGKYGYNWEEVISGRFGRVFPFFADKIRYGICDRSTIINRLQNPPKASKEAHRELVEKIGRLETS